MKELFTPSIIAQTKVHCKGVLKNILFSFLFCIKSYFFSDIFGVDRGQVCVE
jgi:hypothetical protein